MPAVIIAPEQLPPWTLRTEIPTVVADLCEDACDLAVWRAVRWLIALSGRDRLGVDARTIAAHAKVDVKTALRCLNGDRPESAAKRRPRRVKRGLVGLGLLEIVGSQAVGKLKPRPVYRIPQWIEEQNAHYTRALLARLGMEPPAPAPPPGQAPLPLGLDPDADQVAPAPGGAAVPTPPLDPNLEQGARPSAGAAGPARPPDPHADQAPGPALALPDPQTEQPGAPDPYVDQDGRTRDRAQQGAEDPPLAAAGLDPHTDQRRAAAASCPDPNSACWMEGWRDGGMEGVAPSPHHTSVSAAPEQAAAAPAGHPLDRQRARGGGGYGPPPPLAPQPALFADHPRWVPGALSAHPLDLWRRACVARRPIDDDQLAVLASEHDGATGGHGWYWVGRAILAAAVAEDIHSVAKVRRTLERWRAEDAYGSDAPASRRPAAPAPPTPRPPRAPEPPGGRRPPLSVRLGLSDVFQEV